MNEPLAFAEGPNVIPAEARTGSDEFSRRAVFATRGSAPTWLREIDEQIEALAILEENWDSYGASAINPQAVERARDFLRFVAWFVGVDAPVVGGTPDGNVGFSWDEGAWSLDAEILPNGRVEYVFLDERDSSRERESTTGDWSELLRLLTRLH